MLALPEERGNSSGALFWLLAACGRSQGIGYGLWIGQPPAAQSTTHTKEGEPPQAARIPEELRIGNPRYDLVRLWRLRLRLIVFFGRGLVWMLAFVVDVPYAEGHLTCSHEIKHTINTDEVRQDAQEQDDRDRAGAIEHDL